MAIDEGAMSKFALNEKASLHYAFRFEKGCNA